MPNHRQEARSRADGMFNYAAKQRRRITYALRRALSQGLPGQWASDHREEADHFTGWTYVAIHAVAKQLMQATVKVYKQDPKEAEHREPVAYNHPFSKLLRRASPSQSGESFRYEQAVQLGLTGTCLIWKVRNRLGRTVQRYVIPTAIAQPTIASPGQPSGWEIQPVSVSNNYDDDGYVDLNGLFLAWGTVIPQEDVICIRWPHPLLRDDGYSPLAAGANWTDTAEMIDRSRWSHMRRGPDPSILVEPPDDIALDEFDLRDIEDRINAKYGGPENTGKAMVVPYGKVTPLGSNAKDMAYSDGFEQLRRAVMAIHGVSGAVVGLNEEMTYGGIAAALMQFTELTVRPMACLLAGEETEQQGPEFGEDLVVEFEPKKVNDPDLLERQLTTDIQAQAITVGEIRKLRGRPLFGDERDNKVPNQQETPGNLENLPGGPASEKKPNQLQNGQSQKPGGNPLDTLLNSRNKPPRQHAGKNIAKALGKNKEAGGGGCAQGKTLISGSRGPLPAKIQQFSPSKKTKANVASKKTKALTKANMSSKRANSACKEPKVNVTFSDSSKKANVDFGVLKARTNVETQASLGSRVTISRAGECPVKVDGLSKVIYWEGKAIEELSKQARGVAGLRIEVERIAKSSKTLGMSESTGSDGGFTIEEERPKTNTIRDSKLISSLNLSDDGIIDIWKRVVGGEEETFINFGKWATEEDKKQWLSVLPSDYGIEVGSKVDEGWERIWPDRATFRVEADTLLSARMEK